MTTTINAIGPKTYTFQQLVETIQQCIGTRRPIIPLPSLIGYWASRLVGLWTSDLVITKPEIEGLMANLLFVDAPHAGSTRLSTWRKGQASSLGLHYTRELESRTARASAYRSN